MAGSEFEYEHRVTYADCTVGNHVYYGRYLQILEAARGAHFREMGHSLTDWQERGYIFPVCECHLRYRAPARYDDVLRVKVRVVFARGVRLNFAYEVNTPEGEWILEGETLHACTGLNERPRRLPEALLEAVGEVSGTGGGH